MSSAAILRARAQAFREQHSNQLAQNERQRAANAAAADDLSKTQPSAIAEAPPDTEPISNDHRSSIADAAADRD